MTQEYTKIDIIESLCSQTPWYKWIYEHYTHLIFILVLMLISTFSLTNLWTKGDIQNQDFLDVMMNIHISVVTIISTFIAISGSIVYWTLRTKYKDILIKGAQRYVIHPIYAIFIYLFVFYFILYPLSSTSGTNNNEKFAILTINVTLIIILIGYSVIVLSKLISLSLFDIFRSNDMLNSLKNHLKKVDIDGALEELHTGFRALAIAITNGEYYNDIYPISCNLARAMWTTNSEGLWKNIWKYEGSTFIKTIKLYEDNLESPWRLLDDVVLDNLFNRYMKTYIVDPIRGSANQTNPDMIIPRIVPFLIALSKVSTYNHLYLFKSYSYFLDNILYLKNISSSKDTKELIVAILGMNIMWIIESLENLSKSPEDSRLVISLYNKSFSSTITSIEDLLKKNPESLQKILDVILEVYLFYQDKEYVDNIKKAILHFLSKLPRDTVNEYRNRLHLLGIL